MELTMTLGSAEHHHMIEFFERAFISETSLRFDKEPKDFWSKKRIYQCGKTNALFLAFRQGASYGKAVATS
jgi:hypothetical protein